MIDFEIPAEAQALRERVREFVQEVCLPAEKELDRRPADEVLTALQEKARAEGLWCPHMPAAWGGMGLGPLANAVIQIEMAGSHLAARAMNSEGPDDATMLTILEHGTEAQKEKYLRPLVEGRARICFSMTEKAAGAAPTGMKTRAVLEGDNWVLNGEKWFSSGASIPSFAMVMAKPDPDAARHRQFSTFLVDLPNPGYRILRDI